MNSTSSQVCKVAQHVLGNAIDVETYEYAPCYLWHDSPIYNEFGELVEVLKGDTIYLSKTSTNAIEDLFHELGHVIARRFDVVGHAENYFQGHWENQIKSHIGRVVHKRHWSAYLNLYSEMHSELQFNAASEIWAELFMMQFLYPENDETDLLSEEMTRLRSLEKYKELENRFFVLKQALKQLN